jgi:polyhydroxyalkanoate synthesis repressor PhaR
MTVLIKRYANRKLYNTQTSRYITLKGIAELIEANEDVRVIDNETGEDITSVALSQILVDSERSNRSIPGTLLSDLVHRGGDALYGALRKGVGDASDSIEDFQRNVRRIIKKAESGATGSRSASPMWTA